MNCADAKQALEQSHDGELDTERLRALREHLAECSDCATLGERLARLRSAVRDGATYFTAPNELRRLVAERAMTSPLASLKRRIHLPWWGFAGSLAAAAALTVALTVAVVLPQSTEAVAREVMANHVRSLMVDHLADVATSDQHTVKPWFAGKLDFSPPVHDLSSDGFALIGGRLDYLGGRTVAALVYQRRQHRINVFVWPAPTGAKEEQTLTRNGFNMIAWSQDGMRMWAVSDLNAKELNTLAQLLRARQPGTP
jgi:anti-sigma factor RsiW